MTTDEPLKPCPFCGGPGKMIDVMGLWRAGTYGPSGSRITCSSLDCSGMGNAFHGEDQEDRAIAAWNRRAPAAPATSQDEQLIAEMRAGLEGVTPGAWAVFYKHKYDEWHVSVPMEGVSFKLALFENGCPAGEAYARHIARCDRDSIRRLCDLAEIGARCSGQKAGEVKVKKLEWLSEPPYSVARVPSLHLLYSTECVWDDSKFLYCELTGNCRPQVYPTLAEAKAAAQADFDRRILASIDASETEEPPHA